MSMYMLRSACAHRTGTYFGQMFIGLDLTSTDRAKRMKGVFLSGRYLFTDFYASGVRNVMQRTVLSQDTFSLPGAAATAYTNAAAAAATATNTKRMVSHLSHDHTGTAMLVPTPLNRSIHGSHDVGHAGSTVRMT